MKTAISEKCITCDRDLKGLAMCFDPITGICSCLGQCSLTWQKRRESVKVFAMNEQDWMAAATLEEAKANYMEHYSGGESEEEILDDPHEVATPDLDRIKFTRTEDDGEPLGSVTFRQQLDMMIVSGTEFPAFFASTEF